MSFITGPRVELIEEYTLWKKYKGKFVIPIGSQEVYLKSAEQKISKSGNEMIVVTIGKKPEEEGDKKYSFHSMILYYTLNRLPELRRLTQNAFNLDLDISSIQRVESILQAKKGQIFNAVILHQKRLILQNGEPATRRYIKNMTQYGLPIIKYEPVIWKSSPDPILLGPEEHRQLILDFNREEKEIFNLTLLNRYIELYGTVND